MSTEGVNSYVSIGDTSKKSENNFLALCIAHCVNNVFKGTVNMQIHKDTVKDIKKITTFIYRHS